MFKVLHMIIIILGVTSLVGEKYQRTDCKPHCKGRGFILKGVFYKGFSSLNRVEFS